MYRDGDGTSFRNGKLNEFVKTLDFRWDPHQVKGIQNLLDVHELIVPGEYIDNGHPKIPEKVEAGDLILIHDMVWHNLCGISHLQITQIVVEIFLLGICTILVRPTSRQTENRFVNSIVENVLFEHVT